MANPQYEPMDITPKTDPDSSSFDIASTDQCLDLSMANIWLLLYIPCGNPEFEIIHGKCLDRNYWSDLSRGSEVVLTEGGESKQGYIVAVSEQRLELDEHFSRYAEEFREEFAANILNIMRGKKKTPNIRDVKTPSPKVEYIEKQIIKIADKETQTCTEVDTNVENLKRKCDELECENKRLNELLSDVFKNMSGTMQMLESSGVRPKERETNGKQILKSSENIENINDENAGVQSGMVCLGPGGTEVAASVYRKIKWESYTSATRKLLVTLFPRSILATHSLSGKPSPVYVGSNKETKNKLDSVIINDIVDVVSRKCGVTESLVRSAITTKCADEDKMFKRKKK